ncbi:MAG: hypothetical protein WAU74_13675 [Pseudolabrys sp.]
MAQAHSKQAAHSHMHDFEGHVAAVEADLEYWRAKRLEPRLIQLHRRGVLTFYDLARTATALPAAPTTAVAHDTKPGSARSKMDSMITSAGSTSSRSTAPAIPR